MHKRNKRRPPRGSAVGRVGPCLAQPGSGGDLKYQRRDRDRGRGRERRLHGDPEPRGQHPGRLRVNYATQDGTRPVRQRLHGQERRFDLRRRNDENTQTISVPIINDNTAESTRDLPRAPCARRDRRNAGNLRRSAAAASATVNVATTGNVRNARAAVQPGATRTASINSTSQDGCPDTTVPQQTQVANNTYSVLAINDLGMHCGDLDTRIASILPPFQVLHAQVVQKGADTDAQPRRRDRGDLLGGGQPERPDPGSGNAAFTGVRADGNTYKTNFWGTVNAGAYDPFYPATSSPAHWSDPDTGLPVPDWTSFRTSVPTQRPSPGELEGRIPAHDAGRQPFVNASTAGALLDKPFFLNFPFGYVAADVNWYEGCRRAVRRLRRPRSRERLPAGARAGQGGQHRAVHRGHGDCRSPARRAAQLPRRRRRTCGNGTATSADVGHHAGLPRLLSLDDPDHDQAPIGSAWSTPRTSTSCGCTTSRTGRYLITAAADHARPSRRLGHRNGGNGDATA